MSGPDDIRPARLRTADSLTLVRDHPAWFFRRGKFDSDEAVTLLIREASLAGATSVSVAEQGDWVAVAADIDWLAGDLTSFRRLVRYPEGGRNSARIEAAIAAFCPGLATRAGSGAVDVLKAADKSDDSVQGLMLRFATTGRIVAFLSPDRRNYSELEMDDDVYGTFDIADAIDSFLEKV